jgi:hypothetical protein
LSGAVENLFSGLAIICLFNSLHECASRMAKDLSEGIRGQIIALRNEGYSQ